MSPSAVSAPICNFACGQHRAAAAHPVRTTALRLVKYPLLGRYVVDWRLPKTAEFDAWEQVGIASASGASLAALYGSANGRCKGVVVCAHPLRRDAKGFFLTTGRADVLRRNGYDVLLFDFNGFGGSSQGDFKYVQDVLAAARFAHRRARGLPVHALALCFGAVWTLCAAALDHPFSGIILEAPLTSLHEYYTGSPAARTFLHLLWRLFPKTAASATPLEAAAKLGGAPRLLLIGGVEDTIAPIDMTRRLFDACSLPRGSCEVWYVEGARHLRAFETAPREYEERVTRFFDAVPDAVMA